MTCLTASTLNSSVYRLLMDTPAAAVDYGCKVSTKHGAIHPQLTWKFNYRRCGTHLGLDLVGEPDLALEPSVSAGCMLYGMFSGIFTGAKVTRYINRGSKDYFNARWVINGVDKAALIEGYAELFEAILEESKC